MACTSYHDEKDRVEWNKLRDRIEKTIGYEHPIGVFEEFPKATKKEDSAARYDKLNRTQDNKLEKPANNGPVVVTLKLYVGTKQYLALIDTGADRSVTKESLGRELQMTLGNCIIQSKFEQDLELTVGNGQVLVLSPALNVPIFVKPNFNINIQFILVPQFGETMIIGNDTLAATKAEISYDPPRVTFMGSQGPVQVETLVQSYLKQYEDPLNVRGRNILQILNLRASDLRISEKPKVNQIVSPVQKDYVIDKLRKAIAPGMESNVITPQQAELAVRELAKYAYMWVNKNPMYLGECVRHPVQPHSPLKPRRYSLPQAKLALARSAISEWFKNGWIVRGESQYIHPLALVAKKSGKTRSVYRCHRSQSYTRLRE